MGSKLSQNMKVLRYIEEKGSITNMEAFRDLGITRLSGRILDLRKMGYRITTEMSGGTPNYATYYLEG